MKSRFYDEEQALGYMTITTNRLMGVFFRRMLVAAGLDLTGEQWGLLAQLWNNGPMGQDELAHAVCVEKSSLSRVLDHLERRGLVVRRRDSRDGRRNVLTTTPKADAMRESARAVALACQRAAARGISEKDLNTALEVLKKVKVNIREESS